MENKDETTNAQPMAAPKNEDIDYKDSFKSVEMILQNMQAKFHYMTEQIVHRIDDMGTRINELEQNINDLTQQADNMGNNEISLSTDQQNNEAKEAPNQGND